MRRLHVEAAKASKSWSNALSKLISFGMLEENDE